MHTTETFLLAMVVIFSLPYLVWRVGRTEYFAPLVVVQIVIGIVLGPGVLGAIYPGYYHFLFTPQVVGALNGTAWWAVMLFVWIAGLELDLSQTWRHRGETTVTAVLALSTPLVMGGLVAGAMLILSSGWMGVAARPWQFIFGIGMACAVTALPILVLFLEKLQLLRQPFGQRILRYASLDDIAIWGVLALILMDWSRMGRQLCFVLAFLPASFGMRKLMVWLELKDRWYAGFVWLALSGLMADVAGLHFMVGAYLSGAVLDAELFDQKQLDTFRQSILMAMMPVFFLSTGLKTNWNMHSSRVFLVAGALLIASVAGKLLGVRLAGWLLRWKKGEASILGWLLQTKALIMIIFVDVLLDKKIITNETFTALLLMAVGSTMLTIPCVTPKLARQEADLVEEVVEVLPAMASRRAG